MLLMIPPGMGAVVTNKLTWTGLAWGAGFYPLLAFVAAVAGGAWRRWHGRLVMCALAAMCAAGVFGRGNFLLGFAALALAHLFVLAALVALRPRWRRVLAAAVLAAAVIGPLFGWLGGEVSPREEVPLFAIHAVLLTIMLALAGGAGNWRTPAGVISLALAGFCYFYARYADTTHIGLLLSLFFYCFSQMLLAAGAWVSGGNGAVGTPS